jgi:hypothetical protein
LCRLATEIPVEGLATFYDLHCRGVQEDVVRILGVLCEVCANVSRRECRKVWVVLVHDVVDHGIVTELVKGCEAQSVVVLVANVGSEEAVVGAAMPLHALAMEKALGERWIPSEHVFGC